ncbi:MAG: universal stress protein [Salinirussus sp.]
MCVLVPFDGSGEAELALDRGASLADHFDASLVTVTVVHRGAEDPVGLGWLDEGERFDEKRVTRRLEAMVDRIAPTAEFTAICEHARLSQGAVAKRLRRFAHSEGAELVVIGSENAGRVVTPLSSVGGGVATDLGYDVYLVRREDSELFSGRRRTA